MNSYDYILRAIRERAESHFGDRTDSVLYKISAALDDVYDDLTGSIDSIPDQINPLECEDDLLSYLSELLGEQPSADWTDDQQREYVRTLADLVKLKGLHRNITLRSLIDGFNITVTEDYKSTTYETTDYSITESVNHPLKSARVELFSCTYCETGCETNVELYGGEMIYDDQDLLGVPDDNNFKKPMHVYYRNFFKPSEGEIYIEGIGGVLPINVLVKRDFETTELSDTLDYFEDSLGCNGFCETICETDYEGVVTNMSEINGVLTDTMYAISDSLLLTQTCVNQCETTCENCCECWGYSVVPDSYGEVYGWGVGYVDVRLREAIGVADLGPSVPGPGCVKAQEAYFGACAKGCEVISQTDSIALVEDYIYFLRYIQSFGVEPGLDVYRYRFYIESNEDFTDKFVGKEVVSWAQEAIDCDGNPLTDAEREGACSNTCESGSCQIWCETQCESGCEVYCEGVGSCETSCEGFCQTTCQSSCQHGFCEVAAETIDDDFLIIDGGEFS